MVANLSIAAVLSIFFTLITNAVQMEYKNMTWIQIPKNLKDDAQRLFEEFQQTNSKMKEHSDIKVMDEINIAKVDVPLSIFVPVKFSSKQVAGNSMNEVNKFVVVLVLGGIVNTELKRDIYYTITEGQIEPFDDSNYDDVQKKATESAIASLQRNRIGFGPGAVQWHNGIWKDMPNNWKKDMKVAMRNRLRLEPISFSMDNMVFKNRAYGSILRESNELSPLWCGVYKLVKKPPPVTRVLLETIQNPMKLLGQTGKTKSADDTTLEPQTETTKEERFFCVVLEKGLYSIKVLYTGKLRLLESQAFGDMVEFPPTHVIWKTGDEGKSSFDKLLQSRKNLRTIVLKGKTRDDILQKYSKNYMTNTEATSPKNLNYFLDEILTNPAQMNETTMESALNKYNISTNLAQAIVHDAISQLNKLDKSLTLKYLKYYNLTEEQRVYWFEVNLSYDNENDNKTFQCAARITKTQNLDEPEIEITDIFHDKERFSIQTRISMLNDEMFTTKLMPLYWHIKNVEVVRPAHSQNPADLFVDSYLSQLQRVMKMAKIKGDLPQNLYNLSSGRFATRLNFEREQNTVQSAVYFKVDFPSERSCYVLFAAFVKNNVLEFSLLEGSVLYPTEDSAIDAMKQLLK